jgi:hypothetical protein
MSESEPCFYNSEKQNFEFGRVPDSSAKFLELTQHSIIRVWEDGRKGGSGFAWDKQDHAVTDMHVALQGRHLQVQTDSGAMLDATIEKLDPIMDLAELKVPGLNKAGANPPLFDSRDPAKSSGEDGFNAGGPLKVEQAFSCVNEGPIFGVEPLSELQETYKLFETYSNNSVDIFAKYMRASFGNAPYQYIKDHKQALQQSADRWYSEPLIRASTSGQDGQSGGPLGTANGVSGITSLSLGEITTLGRTFSQISEFANSPSRFSFIYDDSQALRKIQPNDLSNASDQAEAELATIILDTVNRRRP